MNGHRWIEVLDVKKPRWTSRSEQRWAFTSASWRLAVPNRLKPGHQTAAGNPVGCLPFGVQAF